MDFMTGFPYWGILVVIFINAYLVWRKDITIEDSDYDPHH